MSFSASQYLEFPPREWSLRWYENYFNSTAWMDATWTSLKAALLTMLVATPVGTAAAYGLSVSNHPLAVCIPAADHPDHDSGHSHCHRRVLCVRAAEDGQLAGGLVLAHSILALPLVLIVVSSALKSYDMSQEMAARSLGASRLKAFMLITLPQIRFAVITRHCCLS
jgi:putative spermidine/putrescine transport system permease protein